jgi:hypothetical protein
MSTFCDVSHYEDLVFLLFFRPVSDPNILLSIVLRRSHSRLIIVHYHSTTTLVGLIYAYLFTSKFSTRSGHSTVSMETQKVNFTEVIKIHRLKLLRVSTICKLTNIYDNKVQFCWYQHIKKSATFL